MVTRHGKLLLPLLAGALLAGCEVSSGGPDGPVGAETARLTIQLTDAPGDLREAWVRIDRIILQGIVSGDSTSGRVELTPASTGYIELLKLSGGKLQDLVQGFTVQPGTYSQLRFVIGGAYIRTEDGRVFATEGAALPPGVAATGELRCPSCAQSGFKVIFPQGGVTIDAGNTTLVVDFDVNQSFGHEAGRSGKWILRPVLHATKRNGGTSAGSIGGNVALAQGVTIPACGGQTALSLTRFVPTATSGTTVKTGAVTVTGTSATYTIASVAPGTYTLGVDRVGFSNGDTLSFTATAT
ncbi:MAG TPA: DUF4382 domain-containing protein, partial [Longimicrobiaceae bacterium]|nr:DUF4382 domain-containing protein [Longimicrobiaceae bacterium]